MLQIHLIKPVILIVITYTVSYTYPYPSKTIQKNQVYEINVLFVYTINIASGFQIIYKIMKTTILIRIKNLFYLELYFSNKCLCD
jgi:hypothetical protein